MEWGGLTVLDLRRYPECGRPTYLQLTPSLLTLARETLKSWGVKITDFGTCKTSPGTDERVQLTGERRL